MSLRHAFSLALGVSLLAAVGCARLEFTDGEKDGPDPGGNGKEPVICELEEAIPHCPPYGTQCYENSVYACDDHCGHPVGPPQRVCGEEELCEFDGEAAFCRPCEEGECEPEEVEPTECDPSNQQPFCTSWNKHMRCLADGTWSSETTCAANQRCNRGYCAGGNAVGSTCAGDNTCQGGFCICAASGYTPSSPTECTQGGMNLGFCANRSCLTDGCPDTQFCVDLRSREQANGASLCLHASGCTARGVNCNIANRSATCNELPVRAEGAAGPLTWELACFHTNLAEIGATCTSAASCLGGRCDLKNFGSVASRYCTGLCETNDECPSYAACVELPGQSGGRQCARLASACAARLSSDTNLKIHTLPDPDGVATQVCYYQ